jgi:1,5-anhydro-D-fructose reductase (1,5-anhydro-D-mannitol-forming)
MNRTPPGAARRAVMDEGTLGWGIVGASAAAAQQMIPALRRLPPLEQGGRSVTDSIALGVFSHNEHRGRDFADAHAIPHAYLNLTDLLAHPDIRCIYVGNHPRHHAQTVMAALAAGKHVLCEPPLALDVDEAQRASHTALSQGLVLGVNFRRRADPALLALRELLADGAIGDVVGVAVTNTGLLPPSRQTWRLALPAGGVLLDRTLHSLDMLRFLLRDDVAEIFAAGSPPLLGTAVEEDVRTVVTLRRTGIVAATHDSFIVPHAPTSVEVHGSRGTLIVRHCWVDEPPSELWLLRHSAGQAIPLPAADVARDVVRRFVDAVRRQTAPLAGGADGVHSLAAVLTAAESLRRGQRLPVAVNPRVVIDRSAL